MGGDVDAEGVEDDSGGAEEDEVTAVDVDDEGEPLGIFFHYRWKKYSSQIRWGHSSLWYPKKIKKFRSWVSVFFKVQDIEKKIKNWSNKLKNTQNWDINYN